MMPEQAALLQKARQSLQAAELLTYQGFHDFAISRAYYTMFYVALAFLQGEGLTFAKHSAVISAFGQQFAKTGCVPTKFHRYLIDGEDSRIESDYTIHSGATAQRAVQQIDHAQEFLDLAEQHLGPRPPTVSDTT